jgi:hypothetical protein
MINQMWMDRFPLWLVFLLTIALVFGCIAIGVRLGVHRAKRFEGEPEGPVGSVVGAVLGLLAFLLAFTFSIASGRFDNRKQLLLDEVNAISTAASRAELLPEPHRAESRALLKKYVDLRLAATQQARGLAEALAESEAVQRELWSHAVALARADMNSDIGALFVESLNQLVELHTSRVTVGLQYRIPGRVWLGLIVLTMLAMAAVGYQFGLSGRGNVLVHMAMAVTFAIVIGLIMDLDRASQGRIRVSQRPMLELQKRLAAPTSMP